jgi:hypothetical protein
MIKTTFSTAIVFVLTLFSASCSYSGSSTKEEIMLNPTVANYHFLRQDYALIREVERQEYQDLNFVFDGRWVRSENPVPDAEGFLSQPFGGYKLGYQEDPPKPILVSVEMNDMYIVVSNMPTEDDFQEATVEMSGPEIEDYFNQLLKDQGIYFLAMKLKENPEYREIVGAVFRTDLPLPDHIYYQRGTNQDLEELKQKIYSTSFYEETFNSIFFEKYSQDMSAWALRPAGFRKATFHGQTITHFALIDGSGEERRPEYQNKSNPMGEYYFVNGNLNDIRPTYGSLAGIYILDLNGNIIPDFIYGDMGTVNKSFYIMVDGVVVKEYPMVRGSVTQ